MLLRHPQADVRAPGQDRCLGIDMHEAGQLLDGAGGEEEATLVLDLQRLVRLETLQGDRQSRDLGGLRVGAHRLAGGEDRAVAGAAAEVAGERVLQRLAIGRRA